MLIIYPAYRRGTQLYFLTALGDSSVSSTAHKTPLYKKGQWVTYLQRGQAMRVQRDQLADGPDTYTVWCEWTNGGYHLETHDELEVHLMPRASWPDDIGLMGMDAHAAADVLSGRSLGLGLDPGPGTGTCTGKLQ